MQELISWADDNSYRLIIDVFQRMAISTISDLMIKVASLA
jgi:hypothetical protein